MKCLHNSRRLPVGGVTCLLPNVVRGRRPNCARISSRMAGMENGIAALISMMARRLDRQLTPNAKLIRLPRAGRFFPVREIIERSRMAMEAVDERLVRREHGLVQLLDPPFDKSALNPG